LAEATHKSPSAQKHLAPFIHQGSILHHTPDILVTGNRSIVFPVNRLKFYRKLNL